MSTIFLIATLCGHNGVIMKKFSALVFISLVVANSAFANESLAKSKNCLACHSIDKKMVGPAYKDVADKYSKVPGAAESLAKKIRSGVVGVWGPVPMPANNNVSEAEALALSKWVLAANKSTVSLPVKK